MYHQCIHYCIYQCILNAPSMHYQCIHCIKCINFVHSVLTFIISASSVHLSMHHQCINQCIHQCIIDQCNPSMHHQCFINAFTNESSSHCQCICQCIINAFRSFVAVTPSAFLLSFLNSLYPFTPNRFSGLHSFVRRSFLYSIIYYNITSVPR